MKFQRNYIEFVFGYKSERIGWDDQQTISPTTTVLQYLRGLSAFKGTKEGCAEGDCGACTVVLVSVTKNGALEYKAVNSCLILLPQIHGKQLLTVEHLSDAKTGLHPVQKAMVELDASQCGFCTPGFVMSLFALYKSNKIIPNDETILDAFAGNLCRCTGYQSILNAAKKALKNPVSDKFSQNEESTKKLLKSISQTDGEFIHGNQTFYAPASLDSALKLKLTHPGITVCSGASDFALRITKKHETIPVLLDISGIAELKTITQTPEGYDIGSGVTLQSLKEELGNVLPALGKILAVFGSKQIRQVATIGGNLGSASPIGDLIPLLMAYGATITVKNSLQVRTIPILNFILGYHKTELIENELITIVHIPKPRRGWIVDVEKVSKRTDLDISTVSAAMELKLTAGNTIETINLYFGGMAAYTAKATETCQFLSGKPWTTETMESAGEMLYHDFNPISDARAKAEGRMAMAKNLLVKFWLNHS